MKAKKVFRKMALFIVSISFTSLSFSQKSSPFSLGGDFVSSYVWRGSKIGSGPNIQPFIEFASGNFRLGTWGSFSLHQSGDFMEADLYASYAFDFGVSMGLTDYYYQGFPYFEFTDKVSSHAFEVNLGYEIAGLSIAGNYILNDASLGGPANKAGGGDMYFELGYGFENFDLFCGAGNGWHTNTDSDGEDVFAICNIGIATSKEIEITENFRLPISGLLSLNPDKEEFNIVIGISF